MDSMKIVRLNAENVKRLKAVEITPQGAVVVIGGKNGAGKSSVLDAIEYALGGKDSLCAEPVRRGEHRARVVCDLGDLVVTRTFCDSGESTLVVTENGVPASSPQRLLDKLTGRLTFDPLSFSRMKAPEQKETLRTLLGLDFTAADKKREQLYAERTAVNRDLKALQARMAAMPGKADGTEQSVSVTALVEELAKREAEERRASEEVQALERARLAYKKAVEDVDAARKALASAEERLTAAQLAGDEAHQVVVKRQANPPEPSVWVKKQIAEAEGVNERVRQNAAARAITDECARLTEIQQTLNTGIEEIDATKATALSQAPYPIPGLAFNDAGVTFGGLPLEQASAAEQLRVSVAIGLALNPTLKILLIRDGSLLDMDSLTLVADMAVAAGAQIWLEKVGEGEECQIIIEDGKVKTDIDAAATMRQGQEGG